MSDQDSRAERKQRFESVLSVIKYNTSWATSTASRPSVRRSAVVRSLVPYKGLDNDEYRRKAVNRANTAINAAIENGHVLSFEERDGTERLVLVQEEYLDELQRREGQRDNPNTDLIGRCHQLLAELKEDDE